MTGLSFPMRQALAALHADRDGRRGATAPIDRLGAAHALGTWRALERRGLVALECVTEQRGAPRSFYRARLVRG